jgi:hypothetical protein
MACPSCFLLIINGMETIREKFVKEIFVNLEHRGSGEGLL